MMAMNLGHTLEGSYADIIATKATNAPAPCIITMDELGYYCAESIALMFVQARSLSFMMIAAGQDFAAMAKGEHKEEVDAIIANTKIKYTLALEEPDKTFRLNRFLQVDAPTLEALTGKRAPRNAEDPRFKTINRIMEMIQSRQAPNYPGC